MDLTWTTIQKYFSYPDQHIISPLKSLFYERTVLSGELLPASVRMSHKLGGAR
jgi:hypothetical protein